MYQPIQQGQREKLLTFYSKIMHGKKFSEITANELLEVINRYVDQNRYEHYPPSNKNKAQLLNWFESQYYDRYVLKDFFNFWYN